MADDRLLPAGVADQRSRAVLGLVEHLASIDLTPLYVYQLDSVPASALYALAWQLGMTGAAGWDIAETDAQRRALLARAIEWHRHKGTPWVIKEALHALGYADVRVIEGYGGPQHDGTFHYDATIGYSAGSSWGIFRVDVGPMPEGVTVSEALIARLESHISAWKNARSLLLEIGVIIPAAETIPPSVDQPMALTRVVHHDYDAEYGYNGTISYSPAADVLAGTI